MTNFDASLAALLISRILTYEEIAKRCDTDKGSVAHWIAGRYKPNSRRTELLRKLWDEVQICQAVKVGKPNRHSGFALEACR